MPTAAPPMSDTIEQVIERLKSALIAKGEMIDGVFHTNNGSAAIVNMDDLRALLAENARVRQAVWSTAGNPRYNEMDIRKVTSLELAELIADARAALKQSAAE
jgi:predicted RNA-binding Zn ribbon-like protein